MKRMKEDEGGWRQETEDYADADTDADDDDG